MKADNVPIVSVNSRNQINACSGPKRNENRGHHQQMGRHLPEVRLPKRSCIRRRQHAEGRQEAWGEASA